MNGLLVSAISGLLAGVSLVAAMPASDTLKLNSYGIGSGGTANSTSSTYALEGISGEQSGGQMTGTSFRLNPGFVYTQQANVPEAPTFTNPANHYDRLHIVINPSSNPTDAKFAIAISTDNFTTTNYIQSDNTVGASLGTEDYQTYAGWGSATGEYILGLAASTTYKVKVKATQGKFTESGYGPEATAATVGPTLSFSITTDSQGSPPFSIAFGSLLVGSVNTSTDKINASFETNANNGGKVYIYDSNGGLTSSQKSYTITSATANLASVNEGYGAISASATQSSGGPLAALSPFNGASDNVGIINTLLQPIYATANAIVGGAGSFHLKVKPATITPAATDYTDVITLIAAGEF